MQHVPYYVRFAGLGKVVVFGEEKSLMARRSKVGVTTSVFVLGERGYANATTAEGFSIFDERSFRIRTCLEGFVGEQEAKTFEPRIGGELFQSEKIEVKK